MFRKNKEGAAVLAVVLTICITLIVVCSLSLGSIVVEGTNNSDDVTYSQHSFNDKLVSELAALTGSEEKAVEMLTTLHDKSLVDESGYPVITDSLLVDGVKMTADEVKQLAALSNPNDPVNIDGQSMKWSDVQDILSAAEALGCITDCIDSDAVITEQHLAALSSLLHYIDEKGISTDPEAYETGEKSVYTVLSGYAGVPQNGSGSNHDVRFSVEYYDVNGHWTALTYNTETIGTAANDAASVPDNYLKVNPADEAVKIRFTPTEEYPASQKISVEYTIDSTQNVTIGEDDYYGMFEELADGTTPNEFSIPYEVVNGANNVASFTIIFRINNSYFGANISDKLSAYSCNVEVALDSTMTFGTDNFNWYDKVITTTIDDGSVGENSTRWETGSYKGIPSQSFAEVGVVASDVYAKGSYSMELSIWPYEGYNGDEESGTNYASFLWHTFKQGGYIRVYYGDSIIWSQEFTRDYTPCLNNGIYNTNKGATTALGSDGNTYNMFAPGYDLRGQYNYMYDGTIASKDSPIKISLDGITAERILSTNEKLRVVTSGIEVKNMAWAKNIAGDARTYFNVSVPWSDYWDTDSSELYPYDRYYNFTAEKNPFITYNAALTIKDETHNELRVENIDIPTGEFYPGEEIPITVTYSDFIQPQSTILKVNGRDLVGIGSTSTIYKATALANANTIADGAFKCNMTNKVLYIYKVKDIDTGSIIIQGIRGTDGKIYNFAGDAQTIKTVNDEIIGYDNVYCKIITPLKLDSFGDVHFTELNHFKYDMHGTVIVSDGGVKAVDYLNQRIVYDVSIKNGKDYYTWLSANVAACAEDDENFEYIPSAGKYRISDTEVRKYITETYLPALATALGVNASNLSVEPFYVKSMYVSVDGGLESRMPLYVVAMNNAALNTSLNMADIPCALVGWYHPESAAKETQTQTLEIFFDRDTNSMVDYFTKNDYYSWMKDDGSIWKAAIVTSSVAASGKITYNDVNSDAVFSTKGTGNSLTYYRDGKKIGYAPYIFKKGDVFYDATTDTEVTADNSGAISLPDAFGAGDYVKIDGATYYYLGWYKNITPDLWINTKVDGTGAVVNTLDGSDEIPSNRKMTVTSAYATITAPAVEFLEADSISIQEFLGSVGGWAQYKNEVGDLYLDYKTYLEQKSVSLSFYDWYNLYYYMYYGDAEPVLITAHDGDTYTNQSDATYYYAPGWHSAGSKATASIDLTSTNAIGYKKADGTEFVKENAWWVITRQVTAEENPIYQGIETMPTTELVAEKIQKFADTDTRYGTNKTYNFITVKNGKTGADARTWVYIPDIKNAGGYSERYYWGTYYTTNSYVGGVRQGRVDLYIETDYTYRGQWICITYPDLDSPLKTIYDYSRSFEYVLSEFTKNNGNGEILTGNMSFGSIPENSQADFIRGEWFAKLGNTYTKLTNACADKTKLNTIENGDTFTYHENQSDISLTYYANAGWYTQAGASLGSNLNVSPVVGDTYLSGNDMYVMKADGWYNQLNLDYVKIGDMILGTNNDGYSVYDEYMSKYLPALDYWDNGLVLNDDGSPKYLQLGDVFFKAADMRAYYYSGSEIWYTKDGYAFTPDWENRSNFEYGDAVRVHNDSRTNKNNEVEIMDYCQDEVIPDSTINTLLTTEGTIIKKNNANYVYENGAYIIKKTVATNADFRNGNLILIKANDSIYNYYNGGFYKATGTVTIYDASFTYENNSSDVVEYVEEHLADVGNKFRETRDSKVVYDYNTEYQCYVATYAEPVNSATFADNEVFTVGDISYIKVAGKWFSNSDWVWVDKTSNIIEGDGEVDFDSLRDTLYTNYRKNDAYTYTYFTIDDVIYNFHSFSGTFINDNGEAMPYSLEELPDGTKLYHAYSSRTYVKDSGKWYVEASRKLMKYEDGKLKLTRGGEDYYWRETQLVNTVSGEVLTEDYFTTNYFVNRSTLEFEGIQYDFYTYYKSYYEKGGDGSVSLSYIHFLYRTATDIGKTISITVNGVTDTYRIDALNKFLASDGTLITKEESEIPQERDVYTYSYVEGSEVTLSYVAKKPRNGFTKFPTRNYSTISITDDTNSNNFVLLPVDGDILERNGKLYYYSGYSYTKATSYVAGEMYYVLDNFKIDSAEGDSSYEYDHEARAIGQDITAFADGVDYYTRKMIWRASDGTVIDGEFMLGDRYIYAHHGQKDIYGELVCYYTYKYNGKACYNWADSDIDGVSFTRNENSMSILLDLVPGTIYVRDSVGYVYTGKEFKVVTFVDANCRRIEAQIAAKNVGDTYVANGITYVKTAEQIQNYYVWKQNSPSYTTFAALKSAKPAGDGARFVANSTVTYVYKEATKGEVEQDGWYTVNGNNYTYTSFSPIGAASPGDSYNDWFAHYRYSTRYGNDAWTSYVEVDKTLKLFYTIDNLSSTYSDAKYFRWYSTNESVATITQESIALPDGSYALSNLEYPSNVNTISDIGTNNLQVLLATITPTGAPGEAQIVLECNNGGSKLVTVVRTITVMDNEEAYFKVPDAHKEISVLENSEAQVFVANNLSSFNATQTKDLLKETGFNYKLYHATLSGDTYEKDGRSLYSNRVVGTKANPISSFTIPKMSGEEVLLKNTKGEGETDYYIVEIFGDLYEGTHQEPQLSATVIIKVKSSPLKLAIQKPYSIINSTPVAATAFNKGDSFYADVTIENLASNGTVMVTLTRSGKATPVYEETYTSTALNDFLTATAVDSVKTGTVLIPGSCFADESFGLKGIYVLSVSVTNDGSGWRTDNYVIYVYNFDALKLVVGGDKLSDYRDFDDGTINNSKYYDAENNLLVMNNADYIVSLVNEGTDGYTINLQDGGGSFTLEELSNDTRLSEIISINYNDEVYSALADQIAWVSENYEIASLNYERAGYYANIISYGLPSYLPISEFMLVGLSDGVTKITATHARSGHELTFDVEVKTLKDKLYLLQAAPANVWDVLYYTFENETAKAQYDREIAENGKSTVNPLAKEVKLTTDASGSIAIYEPLGIQSDVYFSGVLDGDTYIGSMAHSSTLTSERDVSKLRVYPINRVIMSVASKVTLYLQTENGTPYANKEVSIKNGVYRDYHYCYDASYGFVAEDANLYNGRTARTATTDSLGRIDVYYSLGSFTYQYGDEEGQISSPYGYGENGELGVESVGPVQSGTQLDFIFEITPIGADADKYYPGITSVSSVGEKVNNRAGLGATFAFTEKADSGVYVSDYTFASDFNVLPITAKNVGPSTIINNAYIKSTIEYAAMATNQSTTKQDTVAGVAGFSLVPADVDINARLTQLDGTAIYGECGEMLDSEGNHVSATPDWTIVDLRQLRSDYNKAYNEQGIYAYAYPFSSYVRLVHVYQMNKDTIGSYDVDKDGESLIAADGKTTWIAPETEQSAKLNFYIDGIQVASEALPFTLTNMIDVPDVISTGSAAGFGTKVREDVGRNMDLDSIVNNIGAGGILSLGMQFFSAMAFGSEYKIGMILVPTEDPFVYKMIITIGDVDLGGVQAQNTGLDWMNMGVSIEEPKKSKQDEAKDEEEAKKSPTYPITFDFHGSVTLSAIYSPATVAGSDGTWQFMVSGGSFGAEAMIEYKYNQNFNIGGVPVFVDFKAYAGLSLDVAYDTVADYDEEVKDYKYYSDLLTSIGFEAGIEAFAGVGFDYKIIELKLGIFGRIGFNVDYKLLVSEYLQEKEGDVFKQGGNVSFNGEIGLKFTAKILMVKYELIFGSASFDMNSSWSDYDFITDYWEGKTTNGSKYTASVFGDGRVLFAVESSGDDRAYLDGYTSVWVVQGIEDYIRNNGSDLQLVEENIYPDSTPVLTDDGKMLVYIDDTDSTSEFETVVMYRLYNEATNTFGVAREIDVTPNDSDGFGDTYLSVSGTNGKYYATWSRQTISSTKKEYYVEASVTKERIVPKSTHEMTQEELAEGYASSEIMVAAYDSALDSWTVTQLTTNGNADIIPDVASTEDGKAIVAWRSAKASSLVVTMTDEYGEEYKGLNLNFDIQDNLCYRYFDGTIWQDAQIAYEGNVNHLYELAVEMFSTGEAVIGFVANVDDGKAETPDTEVYYASVINKENVYVTDDVIRLVNDNANADEHININRYAFNGKDGVLLSWYVDEYTEINRNNTLSLESTGNDVYMRSFAISDEGKVMLDGLVPDSASAAGIEDTIASNFSVAGVSGNNIGDMAIVWHGASSEKVSDTVYASKFYTVDSADNSRFSKFLISAPKAVIETESNVLVSNYSSVYVTDYNGVLNENRLVTVAIVDDYINGTLSKIGDISFKDIIEAEGIVAEKYKTQEAYQAAYDARLAEIAEARNAEMLEIMALDARSHIIASVYSFTESIEASVTEVASTDIVIGFSTPVGLSVTNTGVTPITKISFAYGAQSKTIEGLNVLPGKTYDCTLYIDITDTDGVISDVTYTVTPTFASLSTTTPATGTIVLCKPDVRLDDVKIIQAGEGKRTVSMNIANVSASALTNSGYNVMVGYYTQSDFSDDSAILVTAIDQSYYPLIDVGMYNYSSELDVFALLKAAYGEDSAVTEIKANGINVFVNVWLTKGEATASATLLGGRNDVVSDGYIGSFQKTDDELTVSSISDKSIQSAESVTAVLLGSRADVNMDAYIGAFTKQGASFTMSEIGKLNLKSGNDYYYGVTDSGATSYYRFSISKSCASASVILTDASSLTALTVTPVYYYGVAIDGTTSYYKFSVAGACQNAYVTLTDAHALGAVTIASSITDYVTDNNSELVTVYSLESKYGTSVTSATSLEKVSDTEYNATVIMTNNTLSIQDMGALKVALYDADGKEIAAKGIYYDSASDSFKTSEGGEKIALLCEHTATGVITFAVDDGSGFEAGEVPTQVAVVAQSQNVTVFYYTDAKFNGGTEKTEKVETKLYNILSKPIPNSITGYVLAGWALLDTDGNIMKDSTGENLYWDFDTDAADPATVSTDYGTGDNYVYLKAVYTIAPANIDTQPFVPADKVNMTYDGVGYTLSVSASYDTENQVAVYQWLKKDGETFKEIEGATETSLDVMTVADSGIYFCKITVSNDLGEMAVASTTEVSVIIRKADLTIAPESCSTMYGTDKIEITIAGTGLVNNETIDVLKAGDNAFTLTNKVGGATLSDISSITIGDTYLITLNDYTADNYNVIIDSEKNGTAELTVSKKTLQITLDAQTITYGEIIDQTKYTISGFVKGDTIAVLGDLKPVLEASALTAGTGTISVKIGTLASDNYDFDLTGTATLIVNKKELDITLTAQTLTYGESLDQTKYSISGYVNDETVDAISGAPLLSANSMLVPGEKTISVAIGTLAADNYSFILTDTATLTINKKELTVTPTAQTLTYGESLDQTKYSITGYAYSDTIAAVNGAPVLSASAITVAGDKTISVALGTLTADNYSFVVTPTATLTVNRKVLVVTPNAQAITYGSNITQTDYVISGFAYSEADEVVSGAPVLTAAALTAGTSTISLAMGSLTADNYSFDVSATAVLTVNKYAVTVTAKDKTKTYDSTALTESGYTIGTLVVGQSETVIVSGTITDYGSVANVVESVVIKEGEEDVTANYEITRTNGTLQVTKRIISITLDSKTSNCGDDLLDLTYTITDGSFIGQDAAAIVMACTADKSVPAHYEITASLDNANYIITWTSGDYEVRRNNVIPSTKEENATNKVIVSSIDGINPSSVVLAIEGNVDDYADVKLKDSVGLNRKIVSVFEISLESEGVTVQPDNTIEIRLAIPEKYKNVKKLAVIYIDENGVSKRMDATCDGDYMVFTTDHLSTYAITDLILTGGEIFVIIFCGLLFFFALIVFVGILLKKNNVQGKAATDLAGFSDVVLAFSGKIGVFAQGIFAKKNQPKTEQDNGDIAQYERRKYAATKPERANTTMPITEKPEGRKRVSASRLALEAKYNELKGEAPIDYEGEDAVIVVSVCFAKGKLYRFATGGLELHSGDIALVPSFGKEAEVAIVYGNYKINPKDLTNELVSVIRLLESGVFGKAESTATADVATVTVDDTIEPIAEETVTEEVATAAVDDTIEPIAEEVVNETTEDIPTTATDAKKI